MKFHPPSRFPLILLQNLPGRWFKVSERISKRLLPCRYFPLDARILEAFQLSVFAQEVDMLKPLPDEVGFVRLLKGAPLSVLMVMAILDCRLKVQQLCVLTGYEPDEIICLHDRSNPISRSDLVALLDVYCVDKRVVREQIKQLRRAGHLIGSAPRITAKSAASL